MHEYIKIRDIFIYNVTEKKLSWGKQYVQPIQEQFCSKFFISEKKSCIIVNCILQYCQMSFGNIVENKIRVKVERLLLNQIFRL